MVAEKCLRGLVVSTNMGDVVQEEGPPGAD